MSNLCFDCTAHIPPCSSSFNLQCFCSALKPSGAENISSVDVKTQTFQNNLGWLPAATRQTTCVREYFLRSLSSAPFAPEIWPVPDNCPGLSVWPSLSLSLNLKVKLSQAGAARRGQLLVSAAVSGQWSVAWALTDYSMEHWQQVTTGQLFDKIATNFRNTNNRKCNEWENCDTIAS